MVTNEQEAAAKVEASVVRAVEQLLHKDAFLLQHDANERSITHRLAAHLAEEFPGFDVDCEYNRDGHDPKRLNLPKRNDISSDDEHATTVFPDVIVHRRGTNDENLIVIEAKKRTNPDSGEWDRRKLKAFRDPMQLRYRFGVFVLFKTGTKDIGAELDFGDGRLVPIG